MLQLKAVRKVIIRTSPAKGKLPVAGGQRLFKRFPFFPRKKKGGSEPALKLTRLNNETWSVETPLYAYVIYDRHRIQPRRLLEYHFRHTRDHGSKSY